MVVHVMKRSTAITVYVQREQQETIVMVTLLIWSLIYILWKQYIHPF